MVAPRLGQLATRASSAGLSVARVSPSRTPLATAVNVGMRSRGVHRPGRGTLVCHRRGVILGRPPPMAEGWAKHLAKGDLEIWSSGLEGSRVHPTAKLVMDEVGVDIASHTSDFLHDFVPSDFDAVVSMCGCGTSLPEKWQQAEVFEDWELDDPDGKPLETFRRVRTEIKEHVEALVEKIERGHTTTQKERDDMARSRNRC